jgi:hypothetical protein
MLFRLFGFGGPHNVEQQPTQLKINIRKPCDAPPKTAIAQNSLIDQRYALPPTTPQTIGPITVQPTPLW